MDFGGGCGFSYKYTCKAQESDYPNCTLHDTLSLSDSECEGDDLSQDIGVRCQAREETSTAIHDKQTPGMVNTGPSEGKSTASTTRLVTTTISIVNKTVIEAPIIINNMFK